MKGNVDNFFNKAWKLERNVFDYVGFFNIVSAAVIVSLYMVGGVWFL